MLTIVSHLSPVSFRPDRNNQGLVIVMGSLPEVTTQTQFTASCKSLSSWLGLHSRYSGPKYSPECPEHGSFKSKNHTAASCLAASCEGLHRSQQFNRGYDKQLFEGVSRPAGSLTDPKISSYLKGVAYTSRQCNRS